MAMSQQLPARSVLVVIGAGGIGLAVARRIGSGRKVIFADMSGSNLDNACSNLGSEGYNVDKVAVEISDYASVARLAKTAASGGHIDAVVHTASTSPVTSTIEAVWAHDLTGMANVIDAFLEVASVGMSLLCFSSMAGHSVTTALSSDLMNHLAQASRSQITEYEDIKAVQHPGMAYAIAKRGTHLRVQAMARAYGLKGARINSISPGIISTSMAEAKQHGANSDIMDAAVAASATQRAGTSEDIASAVAFLSSLEASFITGTDLLVDGGATSSGLWNVPKDE